MKPVTFTVCALALGEYTFRTLPDAQTNCLSILSRPEAASAQSVSLFVPVFESQPLTADVAGINTNGDTTYLLRASNTGFFELSGTATLVQGPTGVSFGMLQPTASDGSGFEVHYSCNFENNEASCTGSGFDDETMATTVPVSLTAVPIGSTLPGVATTTSSTQTQAANAGTTAGTPQPTNAATRSALCLYTLAIVMGTVLAIVA